MRKPDFSKLGAAACSVALAASMCAPALAFADDGTTATRESAMTMQYVKTLTGDEEVPLDPTDSIGIKVPATIPLAYRTDGTVVGPTADVYRIENNGINPVYLDSNAIWGTGTGSFYWGTGKQAGFFLNGASNTGDNYDSSIDIALDLEFDDEDATKATVYDPNAKIDGEKAVTVGHPEVEGALLEANNLKIDREDSLGCGFTGTLTLGGKAATDRGFMDSFNKWSGVKQFGTITWSFNLD